MRYYIQFQLICYSELNIVNFGIDNVESNWEQGFINIDNTDASLLSGSIKKFNNRMLSVQGSTMTLEKILTSDG